METKIRPGAGPEADGDDPIQQDYNRKFDQLTSPEHYSQNALEPDQLRDAENPGFYNPDGDSSAASAKDLKDAEKKPADTIGEGFNPEDTSVSNRVKLAKFFGSRKGRGLMAGGGIAGLVIGGGMGLFSLISGPAEFVHIAQLLQQFHFSSIQDAGDDRFSKIVRYLRDPANPQRTRLGILGNHYADKFEAKMNESGIKSTYTQDFGYYDGYTVDPKNEKYKGMNNDEIKQYFKENYGVTLEDGKGPLKGHLAVSAKNLGYFKQRKLVKVQLQEAGYSKTLSAVAARIMGKRAGIDWHPVKRLDNKLKQSAADKLREWRKNKDTYVEKGVEAEDLAIKEQLQQDSKGNVDPNQQAEADKLAQATDKVTTDGKDAGKAAANGDPEAIGRFGTSLKIGAGGAALVGVACLAEGFAKNIDGIRQVQIADPLMRIGMSQVATGNQVMYGSTDLDPDQLGYQEALLNGKDAQGNVTDWSQARSIQAELGADQTGPDILDAAKGFNKGTPFDFLTKITGLDTVCKAVNSTAGQVLSFGIAFVGGPITAVAGTAASILLAGPALNTMAHWIAGQPIDPFVVGADYGNYMNYGARLAANDQAIAAGGQALSGSQVAALKQIENNDARSEFQSEPIAYRLFNPYDSRTLAGKLIDSSSPNVTQNIASLTGMFTKFGSILTNMPNTLFATSHVSAAAKPYDYGFPAYGFSVAELNNPLVENPLQNANHAADLLDGAGGNDLIKKANDCFGVTIGKTNNAWNVTGGDSTTEAYGKDYQTKGCDDQSSDWLSLRFFIFDTETMNAAACYEGDDQACGDSGFGAPSLDTVNNTGTSSPTTGTTKELAQQLLSNNKISFTTPEAKQAVQDAAAGKPSAIEARCGTGKSSAMLSPTLLGVLLTLAKTHTIGIGYLTNGCHSSGSAHYDGRAVDLNLVDNFKATGVEPEDRKFMHEVTGVLPDGSGMGQKDCSSIAINPINNVRLFTDTCNHIHFDVPN